MTCMVGVAPHENRADQEFAKRLRSRKVGVGFILQIADTTKLAYRAMVRGIQASKYLAATADLTEVSDGSNPALCLQSSDRFRHPASRTW